MHTCLTPLLYCTCRHGSAYVSGFWVHSFSFLFCLYSPGGFVHHGHTSFLSGGGGFLTVSRVWRFCLHSLRPGTPACYHSGNFIATCTSLSGMGDSACSFCLPPGPIFISTSPGCLGGPAAPISGFWRGWGASLLLPHCTHLWACLPLGCLDFLPFPTPAPAPLPAPLSSLGFTAPYSFSALSTLRFTVISFLCHSCLHHHWHFSFSWSLSIP